CSDDTSYGWFYSLYLHDALPIYFSVLEKGSVAAARSAAVSDTVFKPGTRREQDTARYVAEPGGYHLTPIHELYTHCRRKFRPELDRKSTRLNSSHVKSSYAVFCL